MSMLLSSSKKKKKKTTMTAAAAAAQAASESSQPRLCRVAVIGGGVSGMAAAWHLAVHGNDRQQQEEDQQQKQKQLLQVHLFEKESQLGGHAYTTTITDDDNYKVDVDVGFMVFNPTNYPNMVAWFEALNRHQQQQKEKKRKEEEDDDDDDDDAKAVKPEDSDMSLSVSLDGGNSVEWCSDGLNGVLAKRTQLASPAFYRFLRDLLRFNRDAVQLLLLEDDDPRKVVTTRQYLRDNQYSEAFATHYLLPMMAALWSASMDDVMQFPAAQLIGFLCNHRMLNLLDRPQWSTCMGRSVRYTQAVQKVLQQSPQAHVRTGCPVRSVFRLEDGRYMVETTTTADGDDNDDTQIFDHVVFACHSDQARQILQHGLENNNNSAKDNDYRVSLAQVLEHLSQVQYADNDIYVHSDDGLMPRRQRAWASWNCLGKLRPLQHAYHGRSSSGGTEQDAQAKAAEAFEGAASGFGNKASSKINGDSEDEGFGSGGTNDRMKAVYVTYWLNRLQNLNTKTNIFVSLNPHTAPDPAKVHERLVWAHPQFTPETLQARQRLLLGSKGGFQGAHNLWFCGAWAGYGFHEDGCRSGFEVATQLTGVPLPWASKGGGVADLSPKESSNFVKATDPIDQEAPLPLMVLPPPNFSRSTNGGSSWLGTILWEWPAAVYRKLTYDLPVFVCKRMIFSFMRQAIVRGCLRIKCSNDTVVSFGDGSPVGRGDHEAVTLRVFNDWFFVKTALEYDLGLARSYMAGHFVVEPLDKATDYHPVMRPHTQAQEETTIALGDPIGLTRLFLLLIGNRDRKVNPHVARTSIGGLTYSNAMSNAAGLFLGKLGSFFNYIRYKLTMDNSEKGGSLKNIHAHYDLSNDLFKTFLDKETLMYSSAIWDAVAAPKPDAAGATIANNITTLTKAKPYDPYNGGLVFRGTLEQAQWRKLDTLLARAQMEPGMTMLDIGFGWGGLSIHAAKKYGCKVVGITLSVEQKALADERVAKEGLEDLITFEVIDYRTFCRRRSNAGKFDRVLSCEMIEAVGHNHLTDFFWAVEQVLAHDGVLVMEAITTPEQRYETYRKSTDFINTIIFPGSCCPSLHALVDAAYVGSRLTLEHIDNIGLHYAQTLAEWRRRFNASQTFVRHQLGFDDVFIRAWNYYLTYCEAGFFTQTEHCLILVFSRQGCKSLVPLAETRSVTQQQATLLAMDNIENWISKA